MNVNLLMTNKHDEYRILIYQVTVLSPAGFYFMLSYSEVNNYFFWYDVFYIFLNKMYANNKGVYKTLKTIF